MACRPIVRPRAPANPRSAWLLPAAAGLLMSACSAGPQHSSGAQEALAGCRAEADRVYDTQNRYQLSERDSLDTPNSGSGTAENPASGLADKYGHDRMVDDCLDHSSAVPVAGGPNR